MAQLQSAGLLLPDVSTDGLEELDPMVPMDPVVVPERPTTRVDEITAGFLGATLQEGVSQARKFAGPLKASRVNLYLPTTVGGETWYGGIVATDLPSTEKCHVYLVDGTELGTGEYYLYNKLDLGDGRKTYYVVIPSRPGSTLGDVWTWTGGPLPPLMLQEDFRPIANCLPPHPWVRFFKNLRVQKGAMGVTGEIAPQNTKSVKNAVPTGGIFDIICASTKTA